MIILFSLILSVSLLVCYYHRHHHFSIRRFIISIIAIIISKSNKLITAFRQKLLQLNPRPLFFLQMLLGVAFLAAAIVPFFPGARAEANVGVPIFTPTLSALPPTLGVLQEAIQREARHFSTVDVCGDAVCDHMVRQANGLARLKIIRKYIVDAVRFGALALRPLPTLFLLRLLCSPLTGSVGLGELICDVAIYFMFIWTYACRSDIAVINLRIFVHTCL